MTIGLNLAVHAGLPPVSAMASVQAPVICSWGCAFPMQPLPDFADAYRCTACGSIALRDDAALASGCAVEATTPDDVLGTIIGTLERAVSLLDAYQFDPREVDGVRNSVVLDLRDVVQVENAARRALGLLRSAPIERHCDAVHAVAVEAAARICEGRARSLFHESHDFPASLEARKCARAIRRIADRSELPRRPELLTPKEKA